ncbi:oxygenase MpaB family protein [Curtobacterium sp. MCPF17_003]|uniref:oxygenase MpaB family protein n=1 Tax=Curtobacterium sp. MCPF17_003 TaxID=2175637 RepID=UPI0035C7B1D6
MSAVSDVFRSRLNQTFTGGSTGTEAWMDDLEHGTDAGFFGPGSATWAVHGGSHGIVAGVRALLVQALHPGALAGVADHSRYREDPFGRLAGTSRWIATVTYGDRQTARSGSDWVLRLHERVRGSTSTRTARPAPTRPTTRTWRAGYTSPSPTRSSAPPSAGEARSPGAPTPTSASGRRPGASCASSTRPSPRRSSVPR